MIRPMINGDEMVEFRDILDYQTDSEAYKIFSHGTKRRIHDRADRNSGRNSSELSGYSAFPKDCAHLDHTRDSDFYDVADNGLRVTIVEHAAQHMLFRGRASEIGLTESQNEYAIQQRLEAVYMWYKQKGFELSDNELASLLRRATSMWEAYYKRVEYKQRAFAMLEG